MTNDNTAHEDPIELQREEELPKTDALDAAQKEIAELKDKYIRAVAEMQNIQKRAQRDVEDAMKYSVTSAAKPLLSVADNMTRALNTPLSVIADDLPDGVKNILEGIRATQRELQNALERMGVTKIEAEAGHALNPHEHEVMFDVATTEQPHGTIIQVLEAGYKIHDRLLRPARVSVAKNTGGAEKTVDVSA